MHVPAARPTQSGRRPRTDSELVAPADQAIHADRLLCAVTILLFLVGFAAFDSRTLAQWRRLEMQNHKQSTGHTAS